jgi:hypothetical protein
MRCRTSSHKKSAIGEQSFQIVAISYADIIFQLWFWVQEIGPTVGQIAILVAESDSLRPSCFEHRYEGSSGRLPNGLCHVAVNCEANDRALWNGQIDSVS